MVDPALQDALRAIAARIAGRPPAQLSLDVHPLRGGLESDAVLLVTARLEGPRGRGWLVRFLAKRLSGPAVREADAYRSLVAPLVPELAPRLLGTVLLAPGTLLLALEVVRQARRWPWPEEPVTLGVLRAAARLHEVAPDAADLPKWDYEAALEASAAETLERIEAARRDPALGVRGASVLATRGLVSRLAELRRELLGLRPFAPVPIHGDLHPGNVLVRTRRGGPEPVLIDWGRARIGSALEDVSSWLQTLAFWEPRVRCRHDALLAGYLCARGLAPRLDAELRAAYWLAGASNALAGALAYHLAWAAAAPSAPARMAATRAALDWLRIIRRAAALWGGTAPGRRGVRDRRTSPPAGSPAPTPAW
jgi:hypothetical protein